MEADGTPTIRPVLVTHGLRSMVGRDPDEGHRPATTLELLFDLTFVIAIGVASSQFAHFLELGRYADGMLGFGFAMFAVIWAWVNFTWFASAYDTDDWIYRVTTFVQMIGVIVLALSLPAMFESIGHGNINRTGMVVGYVVMRVPMVAQWLRAAREDPPRRKVCSIYAVAVTVAQILWIASLVFDTGLVGLMILVIPIIGVEMVGPIAAERIDGGTPWHPHHIAERYGLLVIITLGEVVVGTAASLSTVLSHGGWDLEMVGLMVAGIGLTFGMWWVYFLLPAGEVLALHRGRSFAWGYGHLLVYCSIAALGAGIHVSAFSLEGETHIGVTAAMATMAIPLAAYFVLLGLLFGNLVGVRSYSTVATLLKLAIVAASVVMAAAGINLVVCMLVLALSTAASIVFHEYRGGARQQADLEAILRV